MIREPGQRGGPRLYGRRPRVSDRGPRVCGDPGDPLFSDQGPGHPRPRPSGVQPRPAAAPHSQHIPRHRRFRGRGRAERAALPVGRGPGTAPPVARRTRCAGPLDCTQTGGAQSCIRLASLAPRCALRPTPRCAPRPAPSPPPRITLIPPTPAPCRHPGPLSAAWGAGDGPPPLGS